MKKILFSILVFVSLSLQAEMVDTYQFKNVEDRTRAVALAKSLRCPQCQNQNLVESNSPIAYDLRIEVYKMVDEGKSNQQIVEVMTSRFGNFVLYKPPFELTTALLWCLPIGLLLLAVLLMVRYLRRRSENREICTALSERQRRELAELLAKNKGKK
ncbi:heme lyase NrfEFG subunit NrfF [Basfia succiniciproducens]|uniref:Formate-dependent nitrite reductase complex subunit n=1 Tax=Basfia succiniciproducens TaxID=653940 RepID=A0A1G5DZD9_9PAST|nr:heme lyase NrfEFG subunit NrfF [Basfia succiniciproducens]QIM69067.1 cytochrome c biogenesis protein CcmH [Basfia succiniciproducens]SCY20112.1 respiratory nitrite reductase specific cytochrome c biogenesis protein NrfF [Basfia succiniciproducens]SEQ45217.1 respiratory nitrite reductase specific cytochrome c biogenesis protein NrfF [Basfia succiniciproducens]